MNQHFLSRAMYCALALVWCVAVSGCSSGDGRTMHAVQGTLTYKGVPVAGMLVCLDPVNGDVNPGSTGVTDEQGEFKLKVGRTMGVAPGEYIVFLQDPAEIMGGRTSTDPGYLEILKKHGDPKTTELRVTIEEAKYDYQLNLD